MTYYQFVFYVQLISFIFSFISIVLFFISWIFNGIFELQLINDILDISKMESEKFHLNNEKFVSSAPIDVVEKTKERKEELLGEIKLIKETIEKLFTFCVYSFII